MSERDSSGRWLKGRGSPNPGGRPALASEIRDALRARTSDAIATLTEILHDTAAPAAARVAAARTILDHSIGRPLQAIAIEDKDQPKSVVDMTDAELLAIITSGRN